VTGTATRKAVAATLTAAAGVSQSNSRNVPCTPPAALVVGDFVILTNAESQSERSRVRAVGAAAIEVEDELQYDYANGDDLESAVMTSPAVPDAFLQDDDNLGQDYYAVWVYTVGGISYSATSRFDLVREPFASRVMDSDLLEMNPDLKRIISFQNRPGDLQQVIDGAKKDVEVDIISAGYEPDRVRGVELVDRLVVRRTFYNIALLGGHPSDIDAEAYVDMARDEYNQIMNRILDGTLKIPYDKDDDDVIDESDRNVKQVRLIR